MKIFRSSTPVANMRALYVGALSASLLLGGCSIAPTPFTDEHIQARAMADMTELFKDQEPLDKPLTMEDAINRALAYNLEHRVKLMETALARGQLDEVKFQMLPQLATSAGYNHRSKYSATSSENILTGAPSNSGDLSRSADKDSRTASANLVWNLLDFGVSYMQAQQTADQVLMSQERRRKAWQNLVQEVRTAYWQAASAQAMLPEMDALLVETRKALKNSRKMEKQKLDKPEKTMEYQQELLDRIRQLISLRRQMIEARSRLGNILNIRPGTPFTLAVDNWDSLAVPSVDMSIDEMERISLQKNPGLLETDYQERVGGLEVTKAKLRMLPGLELNTSVNYDGNKFMVWNEWYEAGARISFNLFNLISGPKAIENAESQQELARAQRLAMTMAVLSQVNLSYHRFALVKEEFEIVSQLHDLNKRRTKQAVSAKEAQGGDANEVVRSKVNLLFSRMQRDMAYAELNGAYGMILNSLGSDEMTLEATKRRLEEEAAPPPVAETTPEPVAAAPASGEPEPVAAAPASGEPEPVQPVVEKQVSDQPLLVVPPQPAVAVESAPVEHAPPVVESPPVEHTAPAPAPMSMQGPETPRYVVRVGSYTDKASADKAQKHLEGLSANVFRQEVFYDGQYHTRLRVGPFEDRLQAQKVALAMNDQAGISGSVAPYGY